MRIDSKIRDIIKKEVAVQVGPESVVRLFGSRAIDTQKGGDIDLQIEPSEAVEDRVRVECRLSAALFIKLGGRKVDVLIRNPGRPFRLIDEQAHENGIIL